MVSESLDPHPSDDALELYSLGRLTDNSTAATEEHLLVCRSCQDRLVDIDNYVLALRQACRESVRPAQFNTKWIWRIPAPVWAGAVTLLLLGVSIPLIGTRQPQEPEIEVTLIASRGLEPVATDARVVRLNIDSTGLPLFPAYTVSVVRSSGREVWRTEIVPNNSHLNVRVPVRLSPGAYWVRVSVGGGDLREFQLAVQ